jgi:DNA-binding CsgD family transcriptional regulator
MIDDYDTSLMDKLKAYIHGFQQGDDGYRCVECGIRFEQGRIYPVDDQLYDAKSAARAHVRSHSDRVDKLILPGKDGAGLTELQAKVALWELGGQSDKAIASNLGISESTVRNHRFQLRKKVREALRLVAFAEIARQRERKSPSEARSGDRMVHYHAGLRVGDERTAVTLGEEEEILAKYVQPGSRLSLSRIPRKEKEKLVLLKRVVTLFDAEREYSEIEVSELLRDVHEDFASLRRYLVDYGFMKRSPDGKAYSVAVR